MLDELLRIVGGDEQRGLLAGEQLVPKGRGGGMLILRSVVEANL